MLVVFPSMMKTPFLSEQHCSPIIPFPQQKLPSEHGVTMALLSAWSGDPGYSPMPPHRKHQQRAFFSTFWLNKKREHDTWPCVAELDALWNLPARIGATFSPDIAIHMAETRAVAATCVRIAATEPAAHADVVLRLAWQIQIRFDSQIHIGSVEIKAACRCCFEKQLHDEKSAENKTIALGAAHGDVSSLSFSEKKPGNPA